MYLGGEINFKIGFPFGVEGLGGIRTWVKVFSEYCIANGHEVFFNHNEKVDVFITIASESSYEDLKRVKDSVAKIIHRIDGLFFDYHLRAPEVSDRVNKLLAKKIELADVIICKSKFAEILVKYLLGEDNRKHIVRAKIFTMCF